MIGREKHQFYDNPVKTQDSISCEIENEKNTPAISNLHLNCTSIQNFLNRAKVVSMVNPIGTQTKFFGYRSTEFFLSKKAKVLIE